MTNKKILEIAMEQSAEDIGCGKDDFLSDTNIVVPFSLGKNARKYLNAPITFNLVSYGSNIVASANAETIDIVSEYLGKFDFYHCFETPNMHWLDDRIAEKGSRICFMAEYFLPNVNRMKSQPCEYETRVMDHDDFKDLYIPEWHNALSFDRRELDMLGVGAYDKDKLIGLAACSADCEKMWQIGVDVLPEYRRRGIASAITEMLAEEILSRGKVPFYCSAWSNIRSVRNAIKCGFVPAWTELTAKPSSIIDEINNS